MKHLTTLTVLIALLPTFTHADTIAIIGTGSVAKALGPEFAEQGHTIVYGSRNPESEKAQAILAMTPGNAAVTTLETL